MSTRQWRAVVSIGLGNKMQCLRYSWALIKFNDSKSNVASCLMDLLCL
jgi:hypothetical protein